MADLHEIRMERGRIELLRKHMADQYDARVHLHRVYVVEFEKKVYFLTTDGYRMALVEVPQDANLPTVGVYEIAAWKSIDFGSFIIRGPLALDKDEFTEKKVTKPIVDQKFETIDLRDARICEQRKRRGGDFSALVAAVNIVTRHPVNIWYLGDAYHREMHTVEWGVKRPILRMRGDNIMVYIIAMTSYDEQ